MSEPQYVCVYVADFPSQALLRLRPDLAMSAVAVLAGDPPTEMVCSANALATCMGVTHGMTRSELETFEGLTILRRSEVEEQRAKTVLLEAAGAFAPRIEVQKCKTSAFIMVLDMTGTTRMLGPAQQSSSNMAHALSALHFVVQVAVSCNLHVAVCMAPLARDIPIVIRAGKERESLRDLPLAALSMSEQHTEALELWGLRTLGELAALPEVELVIRLGQEGKRLRRLARGEHHHLMVPVEPVFVLQEYMLFDSPVELLDSLLFVIGPMLDQLLARAHNRAFALAGVTVRLGLNGGGEHERKIKPALPVLQRDVMLKLLHLDLQAHPPSAGVVSLFVQAEPGDRSKVQLGLFEPQLPEPLRLDVTLARIAALVGQGRVGCAKLLDSHQSDSFCMERFLVPGTLPEKYKKRRQNVVLRRCRPPLTVSVEKEGLRLVHFVFRGARYTVQKAYGPWRKSGRWWGSDMWSREEWDVQAMATAEDILLCVITHDLLRHEWHMEGMYD